MTENNKKEKKEKSKKSKEDKYKNLLEKIDLEIDNEKNT